MATLRDYVDLFDSAAQQIKDNTTRTALEEGGYEFRHTRITGQPDTNILISHRYSVLVKVLSSSVATTVLFSACKHDRSQTAALNLMKVFVNIYLNHFKNPIEFQGHTSRFRLHRFLLYPSCLHDAVAACTLY